MYEKTKVAFREMHIFKIYIFRYFQTFLLTKVGKINDVHYFVNIFSQIQITVQKNLIKNDLVWSAFELQKMAFVL